MRHRSLLLAGLVALVTVAAAAPAAQAKPRDRDHDGLADRWEKRYHLSTHRASGRGDADRDRLRNAAEYRARTNPRRADTDRDGVSDRRELKVGTNPRKKDIYVDRESLGGACHDARAPAQVSRDRPWCSLPRAVAAAPDGATVLVRRGSYRNIEILNRRRSSTVTLKGYPGENVTLTGGFKIVSSSHFRIEGFRIRSTTVPSSAILSRDIEILFNDVTSQGLHIRAVKDSLIGWNVIHDISRDLINRPGPGGTDGNGITANGYWNGGAGDGIDGLTIRNNLFRNIPRDGVQLGGGTHRVKNVIFESNEFDSVHRRLQKDHADPIQLIGGQGIVIRGNFFHDSEDALFIGDDWTLGLVIENNLAVGGRGGGNQMTLHMTPGARVVNNTLWNSGFNGLRFGSQSGDPKRIVLKNNIIDKLAVDNAAWFAEADHNLIASGARRGVHSLGGAPGFAGRGIPLTGTVDNPKAGDYRLGARSPAIDAGTSTGAPATDGLGVAREDAAGVPNRGGGALRYYDMGAYEFSLAGRAPKAACRARRGARRHRCR